ncbi:hypothetical protein ARALYDRAFT_344410 [Arabidopsis lyrata subsp. lyrata]|uniref:Neutral/alkaline non-lysosomal ceramidase C-terminal domain-containing protein n=1 Tax=Arabidopsis lyrata subsp. lyrata TaxID=81972 RepID=D7LFF4_ARALL|nr:hypothetical protein ARALYDRAFT_344410 [Arabidopsis lyrata subsp. lyrata]
MGSNYHKYLLINYPEPNIRIKTAVLRFGFVQFLNMLLDPEFTTMAGRRLRDAITSFLISLDSKEFGNNMHGASTLYGPHTPTAYTQEFKKLATALVNGLTVNATFWSGCPRNYSMKEGSFAVVETLREGGKWVPVYDDDDFSLKLKWSRPAKLRLSGGYRNLR